MVTESVRMWRADNVLLMAGHTTCYAIEPRAEYVFGIITDQPMQARRGRDRWLVTPGQVLAWDPSAAHGGTAVDHRPWSARLMIIDGQALAALTGDQDSRTPVVLTFPDPVLTDPHLADTFQRMHAALDTPTTRLERDERLAHWLQALIARSGASHLAPALLPRRDDRALRLALDYLGDQPERNISLDELAAAAGIGKFRLLHLFREHVGLPPHALQIAHRIRHAQRLLEGGRTIAQTAAATGFADQSHLHRHFRRSLGMTPGTYQNRITADSPHASLESAGPMQAAIPSQLDS